MTRSGTALGALGSLLDRSLVQIAEASADVQLYDRQAIYQVADVWDNNTFPLFHAATAFTSIGRERRARAALAWMADLGRERRRWMVEQAEAAGQPLEQILPPPVAEPLHRRDFRGRVRPPFMPLTAEAALELGTDYDLAAAQVRTLLLERVGTRLTGSLVLTAPRRYDGGPQTRETPELRLWLKDVTDVGFDSDDRMGLALHCGTEGVVIGVGTGGRLRATSGTAYPDDPAWHRSTAGRDADQRTPAHEEETHRTPERRRPQPEGAVLVAATILRSVMLEIRMVRHAHLVDRIPVRLLAGALAGAGTDILAAGARRGSRREAAFHNLVETWIKDGGPALTPWFTDELRRIVSSERLPDTTKAWIEGITAPGTPRPHLVTAPDLGLPLKGELRFAKYTAAHTRHKTPQESFADVVLAHPPTVRDSPNRPWRLRALKVDDVSRFRLRADAFDGTHGLRTVGETLRVESLVLGHDALDVRGRKAPP
ncbi:hypothetical protein GCM10023194_21300 [Planotetraspora phitsanulokensis]|uniref:Uncharacterized protein n=1 Tax=Planotetraspora phitsanulokensis TaxID=575192 RepID=A0A8J3U414_9ACTN|nr:hypothetical protein [Planotetraspora phitsanulokensis]GII38188.1 hypothetical protein Pph01_31910 [Planotetraspora phitsanulokensis]